MRIKKKFSSESGVKHSRKAFSIIAGLVLLFIVASAIVVRQAYEANLKPVSSEQNNKVITIDKGSTTAEIADDLKAKGLIRSDWAFEWYVRNHELRDELKAGTYVVSSSQSIPEIVSTIVEGKIATDLITILPAQRLDQIKEEFINEGFSKTEVEKALEPGQYSDHPALSDKPRGASLEGYLYPESFQKTGDTDLRDIIRLSLDEMDRRLTPELRQAISKQGLTLHQGIILASMVEKEVSNDADRAQAAQVFLKRYKEDISLGSDPTAFYGAIIDGREPSVNYDSPYNTRLHKGLPPGPISNVSESSLSAVAFPAGTDWLFFVAGDDGTTYFSKTLEEHEALTEKYCKKLCSQ